MEYRPLDTRRMAGSSSAAPERPLRISLTCRSICWAEARKRLPSAVQTIPLELRTKTGKPNSLSSSRMAELRAGWEMNSA